LGLTEDEIQQNEEMWREERDDPDAAAPAGSDLRSVGITPGGMEADINTGEEMANMGPEGAAAPGAPGGAGLTGPAAAPAPTGAGQAGTL
jgi:hypothetical protein